MVKSLWGDILKALETRVTLEKPEAAHARAEIVNMEHHASVTAMKGSGNFGNPFETAAHTYPLGEKPILVTATRFTVDSKRPIKINFMPARGNGFEIAFSQKVLHAFCNLLRDAVKKADWDLELALPGDAGGASASRMLN